MLQLMERKNKMQEGGAPPWTLSPPALVMIDEDDARRGRAAMAAFPLRQLIDLYEEVICFVHDLSGQGS